MPITYPINFPTTFGLSSMSIGIDHVVAVSESEFTLQTQVQVHQGVAWEVKGSLEILNREQADEYNAFVAKLQGRAGTFLMPVFGSETPRGIATGTPVVAGAGQTGTDLDTSGWTPSQTGILLAGDYIQIGTGAGTRLHRLLEDADSDGGGLSTLVIAQKITTAFNDLETITVQSAKGLFRMKTNLITTDVQPPNIQTIRFSARGVQ